MSMRIVGLSGNLTRPSKTRALVEAIVGRVAGRFDATGVVFDLRDFAPSLGNATRRIDLDPAADRALAAVTDADLLVAASPVYKGSYTGLVQASVRPSRPGGASPASRCCSRRPAVATGTRWSSSTSSGRSSASSRRRPSPPASMPAERDFTDGAPRSAALLERLERAIEQFAPHTTAGVAGPPQSRAAPARGSDGLRDVGETSSTFRASASTRPDVGQRAAPRHQQKEHPMTRQIKLGAFLPGGGQHIAAWRHPDAPADGATSFEFHKQLAQTAERGPLRRLLPRRQPVGRLRRRREGGNAKIAGFEPVTLFAALAPLTNHLGFIATASTTYEEPYNARAQVRLARPHLERPRRLERRHHGRRRRGAELQPRPAARPRRPLRRARTSTSRWSRRSGTAGRTTPSSATRRAAASSTRASSTTSTTGASTSGSRARSTCRARRRGTRSSSRPASPRTGAGSPPRRPR